MESDGDEGKVVSMPLMRRETSIEQGARDL